MAIIVSENCNLRKNCINHVKRSVYRILKGNESGILREWMGYSERE
jgi:hypothetical protein